MTQRIGVVDIGTNTIKCCIADITAGAYKIVQELTRTTRLGEGLSHSGIISPVAFARNLEAIREFYQLCKDSSCNEVILLGTMGLRSAENADEFIQAVYREIKAHIRVLSGLEEAEYSYLGTASSLSTQLDQALLFDIGGGSTEFSFVTNNAVTRSLSIDIGILRVKEEFCHTDPISPTDYHRMRHAISNTLRPYLQPCPEVLVIGIGGTVSALGSVAKQLPKYSAALIHGSVLNSENLDSQITMYRSLDNESRTRIAGLPANRSDVILAGATMVSVILELCTVIEFTISTHGVRHGILQEYATNSYSSIQ